MEGKGAATTILQEKKIKTHKHPNMDPKVVLLKAPWLNQFPYLSTEHASKLLFVSAQMISRDFDDFTWATDFDPNFLTELMRHGFLTMAVDAGDGLVVLLPKLHRERCVLNFENMSVQRGARKRAKHFTMTINTAFDEVIAGIRKQHGKECWFYPPLVESFREIYETPEKFDHPKKPNVRFHCFEVWEDEEIINPENENGGNNETSKGQTENNETTTTSHATNQKKNKKVLVAGEVGYSVGLVYTSLSGFSNKPSAGSIQMGCTGLILQKQGCLLWDLGMALPYKMSLGAVNIPRKLFVDKLVKAKLILNKQFDFSEFSNKEGQCTHEILKHFNSMKKKLNDNIKQQEEEQQDGASASQAAEEKNTPTTSSQPLPSEPDMPPPPEESEIPTLNKGMRVQVIGLKGRADLNQSYGMIQKYVQTSDRWLVELENNKGSFALKKSNLLIMEN